MEDKRKNLYEAEEFDNIREIIKNVVKKHSENKAFIIKETKGEEIEYRNITYKELDNDIDSLGTALVNKGLKGKRIAIIGKNRYEWVISYISVINGTGIAVPLDKGLPEVEIESSLIRSSDDASIFESTYSEMIENIKKNGKTKVTEFICMDQNEKYEYRLSMML